MRATVGFTPEELRDLIDAIATGMGELAIGPGMPEGTATYARWKLLRSRLLAVYRGEGATAD